MSDPDPTPPAVPADPAADGALDDLPLFPLGTVLFPDGVLALRVFETRYVDLVRESLRRDRPFGVVRIVSGQEVGEAAEHETVGCLARIEDVDQAEPGILAVRAVGTTRFRIVARRVTAARLVRADLRELPPDPVVPVPEGFGDCVVLARRLVAESARETPGVAAPDPARFADCGWVANRLAERLPMAGTLRQAMMAHPDPVRRLAGVAGFLMARGNA